MLTEQVESLLGWDNPEQPFNIAEVCCDRWAADTPDQPAIIQKNPDGSVVEYSFGYLQEQANRLANSFRAQGVGVGDRVGIMLPQGIESATTHMAIYKLGAIAVPLFKLFGFDAIEHRVSNSGMCTLVTDLEGFEKISPLWGNHQALTSCYVVGLSEGKAGALSYQQEVAAQSREFSNHPTRMEDPALIIYTSGTTGHPKGALHAQRVLLGHLPGVQVSHDLFPQANDRMWTPADWAWIGGLLDVLLPSLYFGVPVVAYRAEKFSAEDIFQLLQDLQIRNVFFPPTALKLLRNVQRPEQWQLQLRSVASGGESLGAELLEWGEQVLGVRMNEFYGQTECNMVLSSCASQGLQKPEAIGTAVPGFEVAVVDDQGQPVPVGEVGNIAVASPNPSEMLGYWENPTATAEKYTGRWLMTGDKGRLDTDGYVYFVGRDDDVITSAGYRIGPAPIEDCLLKHPAVKLAAVIGKKDPVRTEIVKAYIVLQDGYLESAELIRELQQHVRVGLAAHEYPREIQFIEEMPLTTTGKIIRGALRALESDA
ncbi:AMP-dependent synthetase [Marinobacter sp. X15-166B]|nr:AMP-dependent synthetase [Marinobacter sp. X15-166B]